MGDFLNKRFAEAVQAIAVERGYQDAKYGPVLRFSSGKPASHASMYPGPGGHELAAWLLIIEAELAEAKKAAIHGGFQTVKGRDSIRAEIVQIAAVCVAALQQHGVTE